MDKEKLSVEEQFEGFEPKSTAFNAYLAFNEEGEVVEKGTYEVCYSDLIYSEEDTIDRFRIYFGHILQEKKDRALEWCQWVINDSPVKEAFVTKEAEKGFEFGFEMNTHCDARLTKAGMTLIRHMFEFNWQWGKFRDLGYSEVDSWALSQAYIIKKGLLEEVLHRHLHSLLYVGDHYSCYLGEKMGVRDDEMNFAEVIGAKHGRGVQDWFRGSDYSTVRRPYNNLFKDFVEKPYTNWDDTIEMVRRPKATKLNLDLYLEAIGKGK